MNRRDFFKYGAALAGVVRGRRAAAGVVAAETPARTTASRRSSDRNVQPARDLRADYIVVGSGAGGGTVAARLVEAGYSVLVLEAGGDPATLAGGDPLHPDANTYPEDYEVPAFHGLATENDAITNGTSSFDTTRTRPSSSAITSTSASTAENGWTASCIRVRALWAAARRTTP